MKRTNNIKKVARVEVQSSTQEQEENGNKATSNKRKET
jgi:hypothetical protein